MRKLSAIGLIILFFAGGSYAIQISGDVWGEWGDENNPYEVIGDLRVPPESTLIIGPGCYIEFQGQYKFLIDTSASFMALGTETDTVTFTACDTVIYLDTAGGWKGLRFYSPGNNCALSYCLIEWGHQFPNDPDLIYNNGAGIYFENGNLTIAHCLIRKNSAKQGYGGGIYCLNSSVHITENQIISNHAGFGGSGVCIDESVADITGCLVADNRTWYALGGEWGGAIGCYQSTVEIIDNKIIANMCGTAGGGLYIEGCNAYIDNNSILENLAYDIGGGLLITSSSGVICSNIIASNQTFWWAGGLSFGGYGQFFIFNNTISDNYASAWGGGASVTLCERDTMYNCIIWGNRSGTSEPNIRFNSDDSSSIIYCCIEGGWPGETNIADYPRFCNPEEGDFYLAENSPCVGSGYGGANIGAFGIGCEAMNAFDDDILIPTSIMLYPNYPNPFNGSTVIAYTLPQPALISIEIYDILGRRVESLFDGIHRSGEHSLIWNAEGLSSGVYFYKLTAGEFSETRKMVLVR